MKFIDFIKHIFFFDKIKKLFKKQQQEREQEQELNEEVVSCTQNPEIQQTSKGKNEAHSEEPEESKDQSIDLEEEEVVELQHEVVPDFSNTVTTPDIHVSEGGKNPYQIIPNHSGKTHDGDDLPEIQKKGLAEKRSIWYVLDMKTLHHDRIDADEFFSREPAEIARITRQLAEADQRNEDIYVCGCCHNRVKVAKYSDDQGNEVLTFIHCSQNVVCDWKKDYNFNNYYPEDYDVNENNKYEKVNQLF